MGWMVAPDPNDDRKRLMLAFKNNVIEKPSGLRFEIEDGAVRWFANPVQVSVDEVLPADQQSSAERSRAEDWLCEILAPGPMAVRDVKAAAESDGIGWRTVQDAKSRLNVTSRRKGFGGSGRYIRELQTVEDDAPIERSGESALYEEKPRF